MPPKARITEKEIIAAAVELLRECGEESLNARALANKLGCSTQPIFSNFESMDSVYAAVIKAVDDLYNEYLRQETKSGTYPAYKASGMGYIRFAREEKELFKLLYMRDRANEAVPAETEFDNQMEQVVQRATGLQTTDAKLFHLEMWVCVHGIATMFATGYLDLDWALVSDMLTDFYQGIKWRKNHECN